MQRTSKNENTKIYIQIHIVKLHFKFHLLWLQSNQQQLLITYACKRLAVTANLLQA